MTLIACEQWVRRRWKWTHAGGLSHHHHYSPGQHCYVLPLSIAFHYITQVRDPSKSLGFYLQIFGWPTSFIALKLKFTESIYPRRRNRTPIEGSQVLSKQAIWGGGIDRTNDIRYKFGQPSCTSSKEDPPIRLALQVYADKCMHYLREVAQYY